ncbi:MAG: autotransporter domain-containing protein [Alphaproteobacteria bacterium]
MPIHAPVRHFISALRIPALTSSVIVAAAIAFSTAPAHAACTVGGGAAIDGFAVGASVNCPTGTVQAGTVPPDGATITNKNFAGGSTTFTYTTPAVGTVQLAGNVSLTAATASASEAGAAAVANNNAQVEALFGGGNGGATTTDIPLDSGTVFGPQENPVKVALEGELFNAEQDHQAITENIQWMRDNVEYHVRNFRQDLVAVKIKIGNTEEQLETLRNSGRGGVLFQIAVNNLEEELESLDADLLRTEEAMLAYVFQGQVLITDRQKDAERGRLRVESARERLREHTNAGGTTATPSQSQFALLFGAKDRRGAQQAFATSFRLSELLRNASNTRLGQTETNQPLFRRRPKLPSALDMFANISYSDVENDANGAGYESKSWQGTVGLDYRLTNAWALGVFTAFTSNTSKTATINSNSDSFSYLIGPFVRFNPTPNITLSGSVSAGSTGTDLNVGGATSSFDSNQQLATFGIRGSWSEGNWTFAPAVGISYSVTRSDGFTDSNGNVNGSSTNRSGAINFGPTISYLHTLEDAGPFALITPSLGINGTYNYKHSGDVTFNNGVILTSDDLSASLTPGASVSFTNGTSASLGYTHSGIFSDVDGWSVTAGASAPVNLIFPGLGPNATTNFQFTAEPQTGQTFMLRVVIPVF